MNSFYFLIKSTESVNNLHFNLHLRSISVFIFRDYNSSTFTCWMKFFILFSRIAYIILNIDNERKSQSSISRVIMSILDKKYQSSWRPRTAYIKCRHPHKLLVLQATSDAQVDPPLHTVSKCCMCIGRAPWPCLHYRDSCLIWRTCTRGHWQRAPSPASNSNQPQPQAPKNLQR